MIEISVSIACIKCPPKSWMSVAIRPIIAANRVNVSLFLGLDTFSWADDQKCYEPLPDRVKIIVDEITTAKVMFIKERIVKWS